MRRQILLMAVLAFAAAANAGWMREYVFSAGGDGIFSARPEGAIQRFGEGKAVGAPGAEPGESAVLLDADCLEAPAFKSTGGVFAVEICLKPLGLGSKRGNGGSRNGMILCNGSGYYDGFRLLIADMNAQRPRLEIGRPGGAWGIEADAPLNFGFWNTLGASWDGTNACIYINGMLAARGAYSGEGVKPNGALRIGNAGYGVGSLRMAVESAVLGVVESGTARTMASLRSEPGILEAQGLHLLDARSRAAKAAELFARKDLGRHARETVLAEIVRLVRDGAQFPSGLLMAAPGSIDLNAEEQRMFALALARAYSREGNTDAAAKIYDQLLSFGGALEIEQAPVRDSYAAMLLRAGRRKEARMEYVKLRDDPFLPSYIRCIAALDVAGTFMATNGAAAADGGAAANGNAWAEAAGAYYGAAEMPGMKPHLVWEAKRKAHECELLRDGKPLPGAEETRQRLEALPKPAFEFFVAPDGDDSGAGSIDRPFASLARARRAIDLRRRNGALPAGGAVVWLRGGVYAATETFELTEADSGSFNAPVVYSAWPGETPVLDGGFHIGKLKKIDDAEILNRLPEAARGNVLVADLRAGGYANASAQRCFGAGAETDANPIRGLYEDGEPLALARWPNAPDEWLKVEGAEQDGSFVCRTNRLARWTRARDAMCYGYWKYLWSDAALTAASIDSATGRIRVKGFSPGYKPKDGLPFRFMNLLEEIDEPGEWYCDAGAGKLYVWPKRKGWFREWTLTRMERPFIRAVGTREVQFRGIAMQYGAGDGIVLDRCMNAAVAGCTVRRMGGTALTALSCAALKIYGNRLECLGRKGMRISCGNRASLAPGHVLVENNEVRDFGRAARTYSPGLLLEGCGARVAHNHFSDAPSSAIRLEGNDFTLEYNAIERVVRESDDQGGIDMWGNPSYRGSAIRYNIWKDIGGGPAPCGQAAIRFDDAICGTVVYGNRFERVSNGNFGAVQIHGGRDNIVDSNVFRDCRYGVSFSPWGLKRWQEFLAQPNVRQLIYTNVNIRAAPYSSRYPELGQIDRASDANSIWRNSFINCGEMFRNRPGAVDEWENASAGADGAADALEAALPPAEWIGTYEDPSCAKAPRERPWWRLWK